MTALAAPAGLGAGLQQVWRDALYRRFFLVLFLQGIAAGSVNPYIPIWATEVLRVDVTRVGVLRTLSGVISIAAGVILGVLSDRRRERRRWILLSLATSVVAFVGLSRTTRLAIAVPLLALTQLGQAGMLFTLLGEWLRYKKSASPASIHTAIRLASTLGFVAGPVAAAHVVRGTGFTTLLLVIAAIQAIALVVVSVALRDSPGASAAQATRSTTQASGRMALVLFLLAAFAGFAAHPSRGLLIPLYLTQTLGQPLTRVGTFFTIAMVLQMPSVIIAGRAADRWGAAPVLAFGLVCEIVYFSLLGHATAFATVVALEPLFAINMATLHGVGMLHVQSLWPNRVGTALSVYQSLFMLGPVAVAPWAGHLFDHEGLRAAGTFAAELAAVALLLFIFAERRRARAGRTEDMTRER